MPSLVELILLEHATSVILYCFHIVKALIYKLPYLLQGAVLVHGDEFGDAMEMRRPSALMLHRATKAVDCPEDAAHGSELKPNLFWHGC